MFKRGDIVRLKTGQQPIIVTLGHGRGELTGYYLSSSMTKQNIRRRTNKFKITHSVHDPVSQAVIGQDYVTPDGQRASLVGTRRDGSFVLETYDTSRGRSCLIIQTKLGRRHYNLTVRLKNVTDGYTFHRRIKEGQVKLNDLIKSPTGKLYTVIEMDTENSNNIFLEGSVMVEKEIK